MRGILRPWAAPALLCLTLGTAAWAQPVPAPAIAPADTATPKAPAAAPVAAPVPATSIYAQPHSAGQPSATAGQPAPARASRSAEPMLACFLGVIPLASGYYLTSTPMKGAIFTLGDAVLIGTIMNIRKDEYLPDHDVVPYFYLLGAVNAIDATLSFLQAKHDLQALKNARVQASLNPSGDPVIGIAWTF